MAILVVEESSYVGPIPDDTVLAAEVTGVKVKTAPWKDDAGQEVKRVEWAFVIDDSESIFNGVRVWGETPITFSDNPGCKLRNWAQSALGAELPAGTKFDTDDLLGLTCRVVVKVREYEKDGETKVRNFVSDVLPARGSRIQSLDETDVF